jgi:hypothetical protein
MEKCSITHTNLKNDGDRWTGKAQRQKAVSHAKSQIQNGIVPNLPESVCCISPFIIYLIYAGVLQYKYFATHHIFLLPNRVGRGSPNLSSLNHVMR